MSQQVRTNDAFIHKTGMGIVGKNKKKTVVLISFLFRFNFVFLFRFYFVFKISKRTNLCF